MGRRVGKWTREGGGVDEGEGSIISGELRGWEGEVGSGKG